METTMLEVDPPRHGACPGSPSANHRVPCDARAIRLGLPRSSTVTTDPPRQQIGSSTRTPGRMPKPMTQCVGHYVRNVIHAFNGRGFDALDPKSSGEAPEANR